MSREMKKKRREFGASFERLRLNEQAYIQKASECLLFFNNHKPKKQPL